MFKLRLYCFLLAEEIVDIPVWMNVNKKHLLRQKGTTLLT